jgi:hypothetical protein
MVDPARHTDDRNFVESILRYIPGFHGYLEEEYRRESDHLLRQWLADQLQQGKRGLDEYLQSLVAAMKLDDLPAFERVRSKLDGVITTIRSAERGYSPLFGFVRIRTEQLDQVYLADQGLIDLVHQLSGQLERLGAADAVPGRLASQLIQSIEALGNQFRRRGEILKGID